MVSDGSEAVRIDKWLWAARFFKTRMIAADAVSGGKVHVNGARVKPARAVKPGDQLDITRGEEHFVVVVRGVSERRGPAKLAVTLYEETEESAAKRLVQREEKRFERISRPVPPTRPDKRGRREIRRISGKD